MTPSASSLEKIRGLDAVGLQILMLLHEANRNLTAAEITDAHNREPSYTSRWRYDNIIGRLRRLQDKAMVEDRSDPEGPRRPIAWTVTKAGRLAIRDHVERTAALPPILYHGTSRLYLDNMLAEGLKPCSETGPVPMTCLTSDRALAEDHAGLMADFEDSEPVLFAIPTERLDPAALIIDDNIVRLGPSGDASIGIDLYRKWGDKRWKAFPWTALSQLALTSHIATTQIIPVAETDMVGLDSDATESIAPAMTKTHL
jgi:DNA-binding MarR family transcriptional regulator